MKLNLIEMQSVEYFLKKLAIDDKTQFKLYQPVYKDETTCFTGDFFQVKDDQITVKRGADTQLPVNENHEQTLTELSVPVFFLKMVNGYRAYQVQHQAAMTQEELFVWIEAQLVNFNRDYESRRVYAATSMKYVDPKFVYDFETSTGEILPFTQLAPKEYELVSLKPNEAVAQQQRQTA